jgi:hypothetical protein
MERDGWTRSSKYKIKGVCNENDDHDDDDDDDFEKMNR